MYPKYFDVKLYNIILLGASFMFLLTAFQTTSIIENAVLHSVAKDDPSFHGQGYTSLAIINGAIAISIWAAPSLISCIGPKYTMIASGILYLIFIASFLHPLTWLLYFTSVLVGIGSTWLWTAQGYFLIKNSDSNTLGRNSGIFWALYQSSLLFGNLYVYFKFTNGDHIDMEMREHVFILLLILGFVGFGIFFFFRPIKSSLSSSQASLVVNSDNISYDSIPTEKKTIEVEIKINKPIEALKRSIHLLLSRDMMLLSVTFFYSGIELWFFSGVYGSAVSFTKQFGSIANSLIGLTGIFIGVGEILGGVLFGIMGEKQNKFGRDTIVLLGYLVHMASFYLIFINLPFLSPLESTYDKAFIKSNEYIAILCGFLLGFGDSCINTQLFSILGTMYPDDSASAFAIFSCIQSLGGTSVLIYSLYLQLQWHVVILVISATLSLLSFCIVEWKVNNESMRKNLKELKTLKK